MYGSELFLLYEFIFWFDWVFVGFGDVFVLLLEVDVLVDMEGILVGDKMNKGEGLVYCIVGIQFVDEEIIYLV